MAAAAGSIASANISLQLNSVGFYQIAAIVPCTPSRRRCSSTCTPRGRSRCRWRSCCSASASPPSPTCSSTRRACPRRARDPHDDDLPDLAGLEAEGLRPERHPATGRRLPWRRRAPPRSRSRTCAYSCRAAAPLAATSARGVPHRGLVPDGLRAQLDRPRPRVRHVLHRARGELVLVRADRADVGDHVPGGRAHEDLPRADGRLPALAAASRQQLINNVIGVSVAMIGCVLYGHIKLAEQGKTPDLFDRACPTACLRCIEPHKDARVPQEMEDGATPEGVASPRTESAAGGPSPDCAGSAHVAVEASVRLLTAITRCTRRQPAKPRAVNPNKAACAHAAAARGSALPSSSVPRRDVQLRQEGRRRSPSTRSSTGSARAASTSSRSSRARSPPPRSQSSSTSPVAAAVRRLRARTHGASPTRRQRRPPPSSSRALRRR